MCDGKNLRCVHNNPQGGNFPDYAPHPAIVLKMEDGSDLLLPIIVLEMPSVMLMAAIQNIPIARPTIYHVVTEMIEKMGYEAQLVWVTKRVHEAYFAQLYLSKVGNEQECIHFDLRPSDAINMAVRCKVVPSTHVGFLELKALYGLLRIGVEFLHIHIKGDATFNNFRQCFVLLFCDNASQSCSTARRLH